MSATFHLNIKGWADDVRRLDKRMSQKTYPQMLMQQGKLFAQDLILATPPFDKATINGPLQAQRKVGEQAVTSDVGRLWKPLPKIDTIAQGDKRIAFSIRKYIRLKEFQKLATILNRLGVRNRGVVLEATEAIHDKHRDAKGRTPKKGGAFFVIKSRTIPVLLKLLKSHVGKLKGGWTRGAKALKAAVPNWISNQGTSGSFTDKTKDKNPSITLTNNSAFGPKVEFEIVDYCLNKREGSMKKQIETLVNAATK